MFLWEKRLTSDIISAIRKEFFSEVEKSGEEMAKKSDVEESGSVKKDHVTDSDKATKDGVEGLNMAENQDMKEPGSGTKERAEQSSSATKHHEKNPDKATKDDAKEPDKATKTPLRYGNLARMDDIGELKTQMKDNKHALEQAMNDCKRSIVAQGDEISAKLNRFQDMLLRIQQDLGCLPPTPTWTPIPTPPPTPIPEEVTPYPRLDLTDRCRVQ